MNKPINATAPIFTFDAALKTKYIIAEFTTNYQFQVTETILTERVKIDQLTHEKVIEFNNLGNALEYVTLLLQKTPGRNLTVRSIYTT